MTKILIEKNENKITTIKLNNEGIKNPYSIKIYDFLNPKKINQRKKYFYKKTLKNMFENTKSEKRKEQINDLYQELIKVKTKKSLEKLFYNFIKAYANMNSYNYEETLQNVTKLLNQDIDNTLNEFIYVLIEEEQKLKIKKISDDTLRKSYYEIEQKKETEITSLLENDFNDKNTNLYLVSKELLKKVIKKEYKIKRTHLCWGCGVPIKDCPKILDKEKRYITEYNFIEEGEQIYNQNGELETFFVTKCQKNEIYQNERKEQEPQPKKKTKTRKK